MLTSVESMIFAARLALPATRSSFFTILRGFETGDERQLKDVQSFIAERAGETEVYDQLHAIWRVLQSSPGCVAYMLLQVLFHTKQVKTSTRSGEEVL